MCQAQSSLRTFALAVSICFKCQHPFLLYFFSIELTVWSTVFHLLILLLSVCPPPTLPDTWAGFFLYFVHCCGLRTLIQWLVHSRCSIKVGECMNRWNPTWQLEKLKLKEETSPAWGHRGRNGEPDTNSLGSEAKPLTTVARYLFKPHQAASWCHVGP